MNLNIKSALPKHLHSSLLCHSLVDTKILESGPIVTTCNSNGYMYEVRDKQIIYCLNINQEKASSISSYIIFEDKEFVIYHLVLTTTHKLLVVKRQENLKVLKCVNNVKEYKVFDFNNWGYPQIQIIFLDSMQSQILEFSQKKLNLFKEQEEFHNDFEENKQNFKSEEIINTLLEKLQMVNMHINELKEEFVEIKKNYFDEDNLKNKHSRVVGVGSLQFSTAISNEIEPKISILNKWNKIIENQFVVGLKIYNSGSRAISNLNVFINHNAINKFTYCFFTWCEKSSWPFKVKPAIHPGEEFYVVGSFQIPTVKLESRNLITCYLSSSDFEDYLEKETFELDLLDALSANNSFTEKELAAEDLMAVMTIKTEAKVTIVSPAASSDLFERLLLSSLNFHQMNYFQERLFYSRCTFLKEVFVVLKDCSVHPMSWKLILFVSCDEQVELLVKALYDLLPESTTISLQDK